MGRHRLMGQCYAVAMFFWDTLGHTIPIAQSLIAVRYLNIVADQVHLFMAAVFLAGNGHYQQDNVSFHTTSIIEEWFEEHDGKCLLMPWPPNSPNINSIEKCFCVTSLPPRNVWNCRTYC